MTLTASQARAREQKILGDLGELAVVRLLGTSSQNLNEIKNNFPLFDVLLDQKFYTVKTRRKYTPKDNKLNGEYNIVKPSQSKQKLTSFRTAVEAMAIDAPKENLYWVAIPWEPNQWCPVYWGRLDQLPNNPVDEFFLGQDVYIRIKMKPEYTQNYQILGWARIDTLEARVEVKKEIE
jgi:hypothetical protein